MKRLRYLGSAGVAALVIGTLAFGGLTPAVGTPRATQTASANPLGPIKITKTLTRSNILPDGKQQIVDQRKVTVSVDVTKGLRTLQQVNVGWTGAHPTNYIDTDPNGSNAAVYQEYPVAILECRGVDSTKVPVADRLNPDTCWTDYSTERNANAPGTYFPPWRMDRYAGNLSRYPNLPHPLPSGCTQQFSLGEADYFEPLLGLNGQKYYRGPISACSKLAPEQPNGPTADFPDNATWGVTDSRGTGHAKFVIWSDETNATLGCSSTVKCSLVVIPIMGISCDERARGGMTDADVANCTYSDDQSGQAENGSSESGGDPGLIPLQAVNGQLWWSASNWRNRITIPLSFAPPANYCSVVNQRPTLFVYGSELMNEAGQQWSPAFCTDPHRTPFSQIPQAEPASVNELGERSIEAAYDTYPPPPAGKTGPPVVNAPVAVNGFAIATLVDDGGHQEVFDVKLDARLLAKLLTESYPVLPEVAELDGSPDGKTPGPMANNPLNITDDPEFQALNPEIPPLKFEPGFQIYPEARAELMALSSDSDVMKALTSYIEADPAARAFINGQPDPWGMRVNPAYKGMKLPTDFWPLKDTFVPQNYYNDDDNKTSCFGQPFLQVPYLPLISAPLLNLSTISYDMEYALPNSTTSCTAGPTPSGDRLGADPRQQPGAEFMLGVVSLSEAKRYDLDTALLESQSSVSPDSKFTSAKGSTFVGPTTASMKTAASALQPDATSGTWEMNYRKLRTDSELANGYPGTMLVNESVPTAGLPAADATGYSQQLSFAAGEGQKPGSAFGQLPAGYLPMTAANGMAKEAAYADRAARAVASQQCEVPQLTVAASTRSDWSGCPAPAPAKSPTPTTSQTAPADTRTTTGTGPGTNTSSNGTGPTGGGGAAPTVNAPSQAKATSTPAPGQTPSVAPSEPPSTAAADRTPLTDIGPSGILLPLLLLAAVLFGGAVAGTRAWQRLHGRR